MEVEGDGDIGLAHVAGERRVSGVRAEAIRVAAGPGSPPALPHGGGAAAVGVKVPLGRSSRLCRPRVSVSQPRRRMGSDKFLSRCGDGSCSEVAHGCFRVARDSLATRGAAGLLSGRGPGAWSLSSDQQQAR